VFGYEFATPLTPAEVREQTKPWDAVLVLDDRQTENNFSGNPSDGLTNALAIVQRLKSPIPIIWVVSDANEKAAIAALDTGVSDYVRQSHLPSLPAVLLRTLRDYAIRRNNRAMAKRLQQREKQERLIHTILQAMHQSLDYEEVMQTAVDELHRAFGLDRCLMFTVEPNGDRRFRVASADTGDRDSILQQYAICDSQVDCLARLQRGEPVLLWLEDETLGETLRQTLGAWQIKTCLLLPMLYHGNYLGGLVLQTCQAERTWDSIELQALRRVSDQCAIALHQTQLIEQTQRQAQEEALLNRISRTLNSSLDLTFALQEILRLLGEYLKGDRTILYCASSDAIRIQAEWRRQTTLPSIQGMTMPAPDWMGGLVFADNGEPLHQASNPPTSLLPLTDGLPELLDLLASRSMLAVPIFIRSAFYGGIEIHCVPSPADSTSSSQRTFTQAECRFLQRVADHLAIALHNAQSYENLEYLVHERTQQLEAEKQVTEAASLAKSEFLAHMSHELRTPLTGIIGFSNVLSSQMRDLLTPQQTKYLEGITACGQHLLDMINDLLDLSKVEAGKEELFLEPVVIQEICDACLNMFQEAASSKKLRLDLTLEPSLSFCIADKRRLKQILSNLLSNAVKFTEAGFVRLKVSENNNLLRFSVEDSGIGISKADQALLFHPFQQVQHQTLLTQGTGLGLTLARKLARLHGGDITLTSELGRGSCFTLWLPHFDQSPELEDYIARPFTPESFPTLSCSLRDAKNEAS